MNERWRPVVGFEGLYEVSDLGRVRSLDRTVWCEGPVKGRYPSFKKGRVLRPGPMASGHLSVVLGREAGSKTIHSLVATAFIGPCPAGLEVRHLDGNPANNKLGNLEYSTRSRNTQDKKWHNGATTYKLAPKDVFDIRRRLGPHGMGARLAREYAVAQGTISNIKLGRVHKDCM